MDNKKGEILIKVKRIIEKVLNIGEEKIKEESKIINDLGAESLDIVTLIIEFEDQFNNKIPDDDIVKLITVNDVVNYIYEKVYLNQKEINLI